MVRDAAAAFDRSILETVAHLAEMSVDRVRAKLPLMAHPAGLGLRPFAEICDLAYKASRDEAGGALPMQQALQTAEFDAGNARLIEQQNLIPKAQLLSSLGKHAAQWMQVCDRRYPQARMNDRAVKAAIRMRLGLPMLDTADGVCCCGVSLADPTLVSNHLLYCQGVGSGAKIQRHTVVRILGEGEREEPEVPAA